MISYGCNTYKCDGECANTEVLNEIEKEVGTVTPHIFDMEARSAYLKASHEQLVMDLMIWDIVSPDNPQPIEQQKLDQMVVNLNESFATLNLRFRIIESHFYTQYYTFEDLAQDSYEKYYFELINNNSAGVIDIYLVDHETGLCYVEGNSRGCQKGKGFTSTGGWTSSIVLAKDDITDMKVPIHEMGHFLNLEHTFNNYDEIASGANCSTLGDYICDTPADPGDGYGAMVNYTDCEMYGVIDQYGIEYKPMINNYMGYFNACYMKPYDFTPGQLERMQLFLYDEKRINYLKTESEVSDLE